MVDICQIACEKHSAAEKSRFERNNQAAAEMIKVFLILQIFLIMIYKHNITSTNKQDNHYDILITGNAW